MSYDADLDGRCTSCGMVVGFHGSHENDAACVEALKSAHKTATDGLYAALAVSRDREAFVMQGARAFAKAEFVLKAALTSLGMRTER